MFTLPLLLALAGCNPEFSINEREDSEETGVAPDSDSDESDPNDSSASPDSDSEDPPDSSLPNDSDSEPPDDTDTGPAAGCHATPAAADRTRYVLGAKPYGPSGQASTKWEVFALSSAGALSRPGTVFEMGRAFMGEVAFTPDGALAATAHDDGTIGLVRLSSSGVPTVVHARWDDGGTFYANSVTFSRDGSKLWVVDLNWPNNGGGLFRIDVACDGSLSNVTKMVSSKLAKNMVFNASGTRAFIPAVEIDGRAAQAFLFDPATGAATSAATAFADNDAIVSHGTWTTDGRFALIADNSAFSGIPNRVGVFSVSATTLTGVGVISGFEDPIQVLPSPFDDGALVVTGMGDSVHFLSRASSGSQPFSNGGQPTYVGGRPQLPSGAALIERGSLKGQVLIGELSGIRRMKFTGAGGVTDQGLFSTGTRIEDSLGAIGVQP